MDVLKRILDLRLERGWSEYRLSVEADIPQTTISSWFRKQICPTVSSIEKICKAYNITLSQFFSEDTNAVTLTDNQAVLVKQFSKLGPKQQETLLSFLSSI